MKSISKMRMEPKNVLNEEAVENKKVVNRPKDQIDVIELEKIRQIREKEG